MSRATIFTELYAMLSDMTVANGYTRTYTPVKSVKNASATMKQTPFIGVALGLEEENDEKSTYANYAADVPVTFTARVKTTHDDRSEIEYDEEIQRSDVISDLKKRYSKASSDVTDCITFEPVGEEEARKDSNKHDMYVKYVFTMTYREAR